MKSCQKLLNRVVCFSVCLIIGSHIGLSQSTYSTKNLPKLYISEITNANQSTAEAKVGESIKAMLETYLLRYNFYLTNSDVEADFILEGTVSIIPKKLYLMKKRPNEDNHPYYKAISSVQNAIVEKSRIHDSSDLQGQIESISKNIPKPDNYTFLQFDYHLLEKETRRTFRSDSFRVENIEKELDVSLRSSASFIADKILEMYSGTLLFDEIFLESKDIKKGTEPEKIQNLIKGAALFLRPKSIYVGRGVSRKTTDADYTNLKKNVFIKIHTERVQKIDRDDKITWEIKKTKVVEPIKMIQGDYSLQVRKEGYLPIERPIKIIAGRTTFFKLFVQDFKIAKSNFEILNVNEGVAIEIKGLSDHLASLNCGEKVFKKFMIALNGEVKVNKKIGTSRCESMANLIKGHYNPDRKQFLLTDMQVGQYELGIFNVIEQGQRAYIGGFPVFSSIEVVFSEHADEESNQIVMSQNHEIATSYGHLYFYINRQSDTPYFQPTLKFGNGISLALGENMSEIVFNKIPAGTYSYIFQVREPESKGDGKNITAYYPVRTVDAGNVRIDGGEPAIVFIDNISAK
ncbi:MAG: hypothetical protein HQ517_09370 [SAR324 cluster bacterium]|nr:hypothetical protein [SAR324 cluster bacterium]